MMQTVTIEARRFPVEVLDVRTGCASLECIILTKEQLQAAQITGQSSKELICRHYNRQGYKVLDIGKPERRSICVDLDELWRLHSREVPKRDQ